MSWAKDNGIDFFDSEDYAKEVDQIFQCLLRIANCNIKNFSDDKHMINYMKKLARIALKEREKEL